MEEILKFLTDNAILIGAMAAVVAILYFAKDLIVAPFRLFKNNPPLIPHEPSKSEDKTKLSVEEFLKLQEMIKADLLKNMKTATADEQAELLKRIAELEQQMADPEPALKAAQNRIADLEALLERSGNVIGSERIDAAKAAMARLDYSQADAIFAEIEAHNELAVQETARAAFGRGEVAEAEIRWHDAYEHYKRAKDLHDDLKYLEAYAEMTWRLAKGGEAVEIHQHLADRVREENGLESPKYAESLNNLALVVQAQGRFAEAEGLYTQALEIARKTIGEKYASYAATLNNLANVVQAQGRFAEAEGLYTQMLEITRKTIGEEEYSSHASGLSNLAGVVQAQGRFAEAEGLFTQALEIDRKTIGEEHPDYAIHLTNLGHLLGKMERAGEGRVMIEQGLKILRARLPADHPHIVAAEGHLKDLSEGATV